MASATLFSIVIPVYNVVRFLPRLFSSLTEQNYRNFEVLLMDDGSTDASPAREREAAERDNRFHFFPLPHSGHPSTARNEGVRKAEGEYLIFVDSDDFLLPGGLSGLAAALERAHYPEVLLAAFSYGHESPVGEFQEDGIRRNLTQADNVTCGQAALEFFASHGKQLNCNSFAGIYRREFLLSNSLFQRDDLTLLEDHEWLPRVLFAARTLGVTDVSYYGYCRRADSVSTGLSGASLNSVGGAVSALADFFGRNEPKMTDGVRIFWSNHAFNAFLWYFFHPRYRGKFQPEDWNRAWREASPFSTLACKAEFARMKAYVSRAKRLGWILLCFADRGWCFPARLYFSIFFTLRKAR